MPPAERWPHGVRARYVAGCRCYRCRRANLLYHRRRARLIARGLDNPIIDATVARNHLRALSRAQIGRRTVAKLTGLADSILHGIQKGTRTRIRKMTERRILSVPLDAQPAGARVPAAQTWRCITQLRLWGWRKVRIAEAIGQHKALQLGRDFVTRRQAAAVLLLFQREHFRRRHPPVSILRRYT